MEIQIILIVLEAIVISGITGFRYKDFKSLQKQLDEFAGIVAGIPVITLAVYTIGSYVITKEVAIIEFFFNLLYTLGAIVTGSLSSAITLLILVPFLEIIKVIKRK